MDTSSIVMGIVILLLIVVPILLISNKKSRKNKRLKKELKQLAQENSLKLELLEITTHQILGVDRTAKKLIHAAHENPNENFQIIDLTKVKRISLRSEESKENGIEKVAINFDGTTANPIIFYDDNISLGADGGVCKYNAQKWVGLLREI